MLKRRVGSPRAIGSLTILALVVPFSARPHEALAETHHLTPKDNWFAVLNGDGLAPGDQVVLAAGVYRESRRLTISHRGTEQQPIVIRCDPQGRAVLHRPDARQNSINIEGAQYLILRGLEITGGSTGIRLGARGDTPCRFVTLEELHIHDVGGVGVTANYPGNTYEGMVFRRNHIHHTGGHGEAFYLGVNNRPDGSTNGYIFDSLVEGNYIHDLKGPQVSQGDGIEIKDGSFNNVVRDNVIHDTNYPGIIVYGTDGKAPNVVERNVIWNTRDHGIQAAADAIIRNNIVFDAGGDGIYSRAHQSAAVGNLQIVHNTVISPRDGAALRIALSEQDQFSGPLLVASNALYASKAGFSLRVPRGEVSRGAIRLDANVGNGKLDGARADISPAQWRPTGPLEEDLDEHYYPRRGSALIGAGSTRIHVPDDFNGTPREPTPTVGAYEYGPRGNPGWTIRPGFKPLSGDDGRRRARDRRRS